MRAHTYTYTYMRHAAVPVLFRVRDGASGPVRMLRPRGFSAGLAHRVSEQACFVPVRVRGLTFLVAVRVCVRSFGHLEPLVLARGCMCARQAVNGSTFSAGFVDDLYGICQVLFAWVGVGGGRRLTPPRVSTHSRPPPSLVDCGSPQVLAAPRYKPSSLHTPDSHASLPSNP